MSSWKVCDSDNYRENEVDIPSESVC